MDLVDFILALDPERQLPRFRVPTLREAAEWMRQTQGGASGRAYTGPLTPSQQRWLRDDLYSSDRDMVWPSDPMPCGGLPEGPAYFFGRLLMGYDRSGCIYSIPMYFFDSVFSWLLIVVALLTVFGYAVWSATKNDLDEEELEALEHDRDELTARIEELKRRRQ